MKIEMTFTRMLGKCPNPRRHPVGLSAGEVIRSKTIAPNDRLTILSSFTAEQVDTSEPLPEFSRDINHARRRLELATKRAEREAEAQKKETAVK